VAKPLGPKFHTTPPLHVDPCTSKPHAKTTEDDWKPLRGGTARLAQSTCGPQSGLSSGFLVRAWNSTSQRPAVVTELCRSHRQRSSNNTSASGPMHTPRCVSVRLLARITFLRFKADRWAARTRVTNLLRGAHARPIVQMQALAQLNWPRSPLPTVLYHWPTDDAVGTELFPE
jgi:hypothetical protein